MYEFLQDENECLSKLLFLLFCSEISDKMVKQMTDHYCKSQSPGYISQVAEKMGKHKAAISRLTITMKATML